MTEVENDIDNIGVLDTGRYSPVLGIVGVFIGCNAKYSTLPSLSYAVVAADCCLTGKNQYAASVPAGIDMGIGYCYQQDPIILCIG